MSMNGFCYISTTKRKLYKKLIDWKNESNGRTAAATLLTNNEEKPKSTHFISFLN